MQTISRRTFEHPVHTQQNHSSGTSALRGGLRCSTLRCPGWFRILVRMTIERSQVQNILIIQPRGIGDIILTTVVIKNLLADFPDAAIDYVIQEPLHRAFMKQPFIREVLTYRRTKPLTLLRLAREVRKRRYDLVIDFFSNSRTAFITFMSGARYRAGRPHLGRRYAYNRPVPVRDTAGTAHQALRNLAVLGHLGISHDATDLLFGVGDDDRAFVGRFWAETFADGDFVAGLLPCGSWPSKKCDPEKFAEIADALIDELGARILIIWGPDELDESRRIRSLMNRDAVFAPATSVSEMTALVERCAMVIANDSGPMHIATAVGTPVLALHGPTNPARQGPFGPRHEGIRLEELPCIGCHFTVCPRNHECFREIPVERVLAAAYRIIEKNRLAAPGIIRGEDTH
ncbi:glycosyltransferase family 9 protein [Candidatus Latescibacterota bacterium]